MQQFFSPSERINCDASDNWPTSASSFVYVIRCKYWFGIGPWTGRSSKYVVGTAEGSVSSRH